MSHTTLEINKPSYTVATQLHNRTITVTLTSSSVLRVSKLDRDAMIDHSVDVQAQFSFTLCDPSLIEEWSGLKRTRFPLPPGVPSCRSGAQYARQKEVYAVDAETKFAYQTIYCLELPSDTAFTPVTFLQSIFGYGEKAQNSLQSWYNKKHPTEASTTQTQFAALEIYKICHGIDDPCQRDRAAELSCKELADVHTWEDEESLRLVMQEAEKYFIDTVETGMDKVLADLEKAQLERQASQEIPEQVPENLGDELLSEDVATRP